MPPPPSWLRRQRGGHGDSVLINFSVRVGALNAYNTGQARRSLRSLGLRHIFASATLRQKRRLPRERYMKLPQ